MLHLNQSLDLHANLPNHIFVQFISIPAFSYQFSHRQNKIKRYISCVADSVSWTPSTISKDEFNGCSEVKHLPAILVLQVISEDQVDAFGDGFGHLGIGFSYIPEDKLKHINLLHNY